MADSEAEGVLELALVAGAVTALGFAVAAAATAATIITIRKATR